MALHSLHYLSAVAIPIGKAQLAEVYSLSTVTDSAGLHLLLNNHIKSWLPSIYQVVPGSSSEILLDVLHGAHYLRWNLRLKGLQLEYTICSKHPLCRLNSSLILP